MKKVSLQSILLLILLSLAFTQKSDNLILYGSRELVWSDFKGKPLPRNKLESASTGTTIKLNPIHVSADSVVLEVSNYFICDKSWTITDSAIVLEHERGHFDISEIYARKMRKQFVESKFNLKNLNNDVQNVFKKYDRELDLRQDKYDLETKHSIDRKRQGEWTKQIQRELMGLELYNQTRIQLRIKN